MAQKKNGGAPLNWRSKTITGGVARSPNRAMLRAVGFGDGDFEKPIVLRTRRFMRVRSVRCFRSICCV